MNNKDDQMKASDEPFYDHDTLISLLDAYSTGELESTEKDQIEQHLLRCNECRQSLANLNHIRDVFRIPESSMQDRKVATIFSGRTPTYASSVLAERVMNHIHTTNSEGKRNEKERPLMIQKRNANTRWPTKYFGIGMLAAALCLIILIVAFAPTLVQFISKSMGSNHGGAVYGSPNFWQVQQEQTIAKSGADVFAIKYVDVSAQSFRLFYVSSSSALGEPPQVSATSALSSQPKKELSLPIKNQLLGKLGKFSI